MIISVSDPTYILSNSGPGYRSEPGFGSPDLITVNKAKDKND
jgi:hypothetical protein